MSEQTAAPSAHSYPCEGCGASMQFVPGTGSLRCEHCGHTRKVVAATHAVREHSFNELAARQRQPIQTLAAHQYACPSCGARTECDSLARDCQFCAAPLVADTSGGAMIAPEAVVPFKLNRGKARDALREWVKSRWFAPNRLKKVTEAESSKSTYVPHWTYDASTKSSYQGERGTHYYVTQTYTTTVNGKSVTRTRRVRKTRWRPANGNVSRDFDDVLVMATRHVTQQQLAELEPWPLKKAKPYRPDYLAGHHALRYDVEPEAGLAVAKHKMAEKINGDCRKDIGGDEQRVHHVDTRYSQVTYKLLLLPVWICCYLFAGKTWQVLINGVSGEVQGQRPYSFWKIASAVTAGVALIAAIVTLIVLINGN